MSIASRVSNAVEFARTQGARRFLQELHFRAANAWYDGRLGVRTQGMVRLEELGIHNNDSLEYVPIGYKSLYRALSWVPLPAHQVSFVDFGAGKGRGLVVAATFPFQSVVGVELSAALGSIARENLRNLRHRRAKSVELIVGNALDYAIPDHANVFYFFNAFIGETLESVVRNVLAAFEVKPRPIYIVYFNTIHFEALRAERGYSWIRPLRRASFYPNYSLGIYEIPFNYKAGANTAR
jgi:hypothetical protein